MLAKSQVYKIILIIPVHNGQETFGKEAEEGFTHYGYDPGDGLLFIRGEIAEHIVNNIGLAVFDIGYSRSSDAYPEAGEVPAFQAGDDGINPSVPTRAATLADADFAQRKVKVIVDDQKVVGADIESFYQKVD